MTNKNKKILRLMIIPLIAGIYITHVVLNNSLPKPRTAVAAIALGSETQANNLTPTTQNYSDTAIDAEGNTVVVWSMTDAGAADTSGLGVYYRRFDKNGTALDAGDVLVNTSVTGAQTQPVVAMDEDGNFVVVWSGAGDQTGEDDTSGVFLQAFQSDGTAVGGEIRVNTTTTGTQDEPSVSLDYDGPGTATTLVVSWTSDSTGNDDVLFQRFTANFTQAINPPAEAGAETTANTVTAGAQNTSDVAMNNLGEFIVAWYGDNGAGNRDMYQVYAQNGTAIGTNSEANTATAGASISAAADKTPRPSLDDYYDKRFILAYKATFGADGDGIAARRITCTDPNPTNATDTDTACTLDTIELIASTDLTGTEQYPNVAADYLGNFTVTWQDSALDGNSEGIAAQSYTYQGKRINSNFVANTTVAGNQIRPAIAMNTDGFYTISFTDSAGDNNLFQNYITEIYKTQSETLAHSAGADNQANVKTAVAPNGNIAYVWTDYTTNKVQFTLKQFNPISSPPDYTTLVSDSTVSDGGNVDNPAVSFFKDSSGSDVGKFIIVWESDDLGDKDIYYQIFGADGVVEGSVTAISSSANTQTYPDVAAGNYPKFVVGWLDETASTFEAGYYSSGFTFNQLASCTTCGDIKVDLEPSTERAVYAWQSDSAGLNEVFIRQTSAGTLKGSATQVSPASLNDGDPDVAFVDLDDYVVTYTEITGGATSDVYGRTYEFDDTGPINAGTRFDMTQFPASNDSEYGTAVAGDPSNSVFIAVWADTPLGAGGNDEIFGQFYGFTGTGGTNVLAFGPTFRINSTKSGNQALPSVATNSNGQISVAWEGNYDQNSITDTNAATYQLLQNPLMPQSVLELSPTASQEVQAGGQFLDVPTSITFPDAALSATDPTIQTVSVRDATYGGDTKYVEIQDATGVDFTFSVQAGDFYSAADGKSYIKNDQHFKVRNWDQDTTGVDDVGACNADHDACYTTVESTRYPANPTAFSLNSATQSFEFADTQQILAKKQGTVENEIGRWKIYPEFQITVPPLIPPGAHNAQITFTLT